MSIYATEAQELPTARALAHAASGGAVAPLPPFCKLAVVATARLGIAATGLDQDAGAVRAPTGRVAMHLAVTMRLAPVT